MLVVGYKCSHCLNKFWGPEINIKKEEGFCPVCGEKSTLKTDGRKWDVEISSLDKQKQN